jgi:electron transfer flavoprotein alpha subunit
MEQVLLLAFTEEDGLVAQAGLEALSQAKAIADAIPGSALYVGLIGYNTATGTNQLAGCGAKSFFSVAGADFSQPRYSTDVLAAEAICRAVEPTVIVCSGTSRGARAMPGVAARLEGRADTHITDVAVSNGKLTLKRWFYRQRMEGVLMRERRPWVIIIDPGSAEPWSGAPGSASAETIPLSLSDSQRRTTVEGIVSPDGKEQTIRPDAQLLLVAGAGWTKKQPDGSTHLNEAREHILSFLSKSGASLGSSKSLVDMEMDEASRKAFSFMSHLNQVGQTGATPRHPQGLSTCCHGEEPHVVGWRFINERRAINLDPNCGWARGKADVLYVADAFKVMAKVNDMLG